MAQDSFDTNLMKMIAAELYYLAGLLTAREMYAKSYFSLGMGEKGAVDQAVLGSIGGNYGGITPELLRGQMPQQPMGFQAPIQAVQPTEGPKKT